MTGSILIVLAFVLSLLASVLTFAPPYWRLPHLGWLALAFYFLALILGAR